MLFSTLNYITYNSFKKNQKTHNQPQRENNMLSRDLTGPSITMRSFAISCYGGVRSGVVQKQVKVQRMLTASRKAHLAGADVRQPDIAYKGIAMGLGRTCICSCFLDLNIT